MSEQAIENALQTLKNRIRGAARARDFGKVKELWVDFIAADGSLDRDFCHEIADEVSGRGDKNQAGELLFMLLAKVRSQGQPGDAFDLLRRIAALAPRIPELRTELIAHYRTDYGHFAGLEQALKRTGLLVNGAVDKAVLELDNAFFYKPGDFVEHRRGWGVGEVIDTQPETGDIIVNFKEKTGHRMSAEMGRKTLVSKDADDFEIMLWTSPDELKEMSVEDPLALLKKAVRSYPGQMVARDVRERLSGAGKPLSKAEWTKFWSKARRLARQDPWIDIGPSPKCTMTLREQPLNREDEVTASVQRAPTFAARLKICVTEVNAILDARRSNKDAPQDVPAWLAPSLVSMDKDLQRKTKDVSKTQAGRIEYELFKAHAGFAFPQILQDLRLEVMDSKSLLVRDAASFREELKIAQAASADPTVGDPTMGDPTMGDPTMGDPTMGDPTMGDPTMGDPTAEAGDPTAEAGDPTADPALVEAERVSQEAEVKVSADFLTLGVVNALKAADSLVEVFPKITTDNYRKRAVRLIRYAFPETWLNRLRELLSTPPISLFDTIANELVTHQAGWVIHMVASEVFIDPKAHPIALGAITRCHFQKKLPEHLPLRRDFELVTKLISVLDTYTLTYRSASERVEKARLKAISDNLKNVLSEKSSSVIKHVVEKCSEEENRRLLFLVRQSPAITRVIVTGVETLLARKHPALLAATSSKSETDGGFVMTTRAGLSKRQAELRHILEVEVPQNKIDIGNALAQGDISENAELDAARQKQELLSKKIQSLQEEMSRVKIIDFKKLKGKKVEVGCRIKIRNNKTEVVNNFVILGPWDTSDEKGYISYLSPVAQGVLGKKVGAVAPVKLPGQKVPVEFDILEIGVPTPQEL